MTAEPLVRRAEAQDAAELARLVSRFFAEEGFPARPDKSEAVEFLTSPGNAAFLAYPPEGRAPGTASAPGSAVGVATVTVTFGFETGRYAELEDLFVDEPWRDRGIGRLLVTTAASWCRSQGCRELEVIITPEAEARYGLTAWYVSAGFEDTGRRVLWLHL